MSEDYFALIHTKPSAKGVNAQTSCWAPWKVIVDMSESSKSHWLAHLVERQTQQLVVGLRNSTLIC